MVGMTNAGGFGGGGKLNAIISVTYPEGSTCTVTNGTKTYKAKDTTGSALFNVAAGSWTVSCTDGESTASKEITAIENFAVVVSLSYRFYIFKSGEGLLVDMEYYGSGSGYTDSNQRGWRYPTDHEYMYAYNYADGSWPAITTVLDLADYNTVCAECISSVSSSYPSYRTKITVGTGTNVSTWKTEASASVDLSTERTITTLDITDYDSKALAWIQDGARTYIYNLWLE